MDYEFDTKGIDRALALLAQAQDELINAAKSAGEAVGVAEYIKKQVGKLLEPYYLAQVNALLFEQHCLPRSYFSPEDWAEMVQQWRSGERKAVLDGIVYSIDKITYYGEGGPGFVRLSRKNSDITLPQKF